MIRIIFWEMVLLLASIPVFRTVWHWMDSVAFLKTEAGFVVSLGLGVVLTILALKRLNMHMKG